MQILSKKYGSRAEGMTQMMTRTGIPEDIKFVWEGAKAGDTKRAHRLLQYAEKQGKQNEVLIY